MNPLGYSALRLRLQYEFSFRYGIYVYPVNFKMSVKCYGGIPTVKLIDGRSPLEGLVIFEPDTYVCFDNFTTKAAELVCGELGFPAAEEFTAQSLPMAARANNNQWLSCPEGDRSKRRLMDCSLATRRCYLKQAVRLKCKGPLRSCDDPGQVYHGYWDSSITEFGSRLTLTCTKGYVIYGSATLQCVGLPGWSTYFPVWNASVPSCSRMGML
ncbi:uncharacterized protein [Diadema setosum]|uniref:uncharacterized protein n=1 Tax=Diadema setosum TaxID=31175 RepID=UPI003B3AD6E1